MLYQLTETVIPVKIYNPYVESISEIKYKIHSRVLRLDGHKATVVVTKYRIQLGESGLSPNTINRRLAAIKSLVAFGRKLGICSYAIDVDNVTLQPYRDTSGVTEAEFLQVIRGCHRSTLIGK